MDKYGHVVNVPERNVKIAYPNSWSCNIEVHASLNKKWREYILFGFKVHGETILSLSLSLSICSLFSYLLTYLTSLFLNLWIPFKNYLYEKLIIRKTKGNKNCKFDYEWRLWLKNEDFFQNSNVHYLSNIKRAVVKI